MPKTHDVFSLLGVRSTLITSALATLGLLAIGGCGGLNLGQADSDTKSDAQSTRRPGDEAIAVIIDGRSITIEEIHEHMKDQFLEEFLRQPEDRQFEMREGAIRTLVQEHVVEIEAIKRGKTSAELFEEITAAVPEPTAEDVADWYSKNQTRVRGAPLEDIASAIKDLLAQERRAQAVKDFLDPKLAALSWQMVLTPPRKNLEATRLVRGPADAPITIMTFSDYQCPYCVRAEPVLAEVLLRYPNQVRVNHRHFPLDNIHSFARRASEAAMCADERGKFWEFHDAIFALNGQLDENSLAGIAASVGLDVDAYGVCVEERRYKDFVEADFAAGRDAGVTGTPSFFLNGIALKGARDADELSRNVDLELERLNQTQ